jgi:hypothetical protein
MSEVSRPVGGRAAPGGRRAWWDEIRTRSEPAAREAREQQVRSGEGRRARSRSLRAALLAAALAGAALLLGAPRSARAEEGDLEGLYAATRESGDAATNLAAGTTSFPAPSDVGLALAPAAEAWLVSASGRALGVSVASAGAPPPRPFLVPEDGLPSKRIREAARRITEWQDALLGSRDGALASLWPEDLTPEEALALKLEVERGPDRHTLLHIVRNDLDGDGPREAFFARVRERGEALLLARGGRPAVTIVNTDVDDTWIASLWDRGRYARGTPYPGYADLLAAQGEHLVALTARPGVIASGTRAAAIERLGLTGFPEERLALSVAPGETREVLDSVEMGLVKAEVLIAERRLFPEARIVFDGDSGQGDWIAALVFRHLEGEAASYATIHDVRPWSRAHRNAVRAALLESERLERIYRGALGLPLEGRLGDADDLRLDAALARLRALVDLALAGPEGRLDAAALRERGIYLFRSHAALALDLAEDGRIEPAAALRVVAAAAPRLRFLRAHPFGLDDGLAATVALRLERITRGGGAECWRALAGGR